MHLRSQNGLQSGITLVCHLSPHIQVVLRVWKLRYRKPYKIAHLELWDVNNFTVFSATLLLLTFHQCTGQTCTLTLLDWFRLQREVNLVSFEDVKILTINFIQILKMRGKYFYCKKLMVEFGCANVSCSVLLVNKMLYAAVALKTATLVEIFI